MSSKNERKFRALHGEVCVRAAEKLLLIMDTFGDKAVSDCSVPHAKFISEFLNAQAGPAPEKAEKKARAAESADLEPSPAKPSPWVKDFENALRDSIEVPETNSNSSQVK